MSLARDFDLTGNVVATMRRIGRPVTASEVCSNLRGGAHGDVDRVSRRLSELADVGLLASFVRREPIHHRSTQSVERRYFELRGGNHHE